MYKTLSRAVSLLVNKSWDFGSYPEQRPNWKYPITPGAPLGNWGSKFGRVSLLHRVGKYLLREAKCKVPKLCGFIFRMPNFG